MLLKTLAAVSVGVLAVIFCVVLNLVLVSGDSGLRVSRKDSFLCNFVEEFTEIKGLVGGLMEDT